MSPDAFTPDPLLMHSLFVALPSGQKIAYLYANSDIIITNQKKGT
jgi:hypothetical protein